MLFVVLVALDAETASAVAGFAAIHTKIANIILPRASGDVRACHEITKLLLPNSYDPTGVLLKPSLGNNPD